MRCYNCHVENAEGEIYCRKCGMNLTMSSKSLMALPTRLPAVFYRSPMPRRVVAGVGALALGMGIELLRRSMLSRQMKKRTLPVLSISRLKDTLFSRSAESVKLPKGYELQETVVYMTRIVRRKD
jgi:hypothetical protein